MERTDKATGYAVAVSDATDEMRRRGRDLVREETRVEAPVDRIEALERRVDALEKRPIALIPKGLSPETVAAITEEVQRLGRAFLSNAVPPVPSGGTGLDQSALADHAGRIERIESALERLAAGGGAGDAVAELRERLEAVEVLSQDTIPELGNALRNVVEQFTDLSARMGQRERRVDERLAKVREVLVAQQRQVTAVFAVVQEAAA